MRHRRPARGFSLIELLIVVVAREVEIDAVALGNLREQARALAPATP